MRYANWFRGTLWCGAKFFLLFSGKELAEREDKKAFFRVFDMKIVVCATISATERDIRDDALLHPHLLRPLLWRVGGEDKAKCHLPRPQGLFME